MPAGGGAALSPPDERELSSLVGIGDENWPLFVRAHNWLRLLDATLERPFFTPAERSAAAARTSGWHAEAGGMESLLDDFDDFDESDESDDGGDATGDDEADEDDAAPGVEVARERPRARRRRGGGEARVRTEMTFDFFEGVLWPHMLTHRAATAEKVSRRQLLDQARGAEARRAVERSKFKASMVFREICSYIKASRAPSPPPAALIPPRARRPHRLYVRPRPTHARPGLLRRARL